MLAANGDPTELNTVLAVKDSCDGPSILCSNDATPPGGLGSRISGILHPGTYLVIATGHSANDLGPYQLQVKFTGLPCAPQCDGKDCGDDGCGDLCGPCDAPNVCSVTGQCIDPTDP